MRKASRVRPVDGPTTPTCGSTRTGGSLRAGNPRAFRQRSCSSRAATMTSWICPRRSRQPWADPSAGGGRHPRDRGHRARPLCPMGRRFRTPALVGLRPACRIPRASGDLPRLVGGRVAAHLAGLVAQEPPYDRGCAGRRRRYGDDPVGGARPFSGGWIGEAKDLRKALGRSVSVRVVGWGAAEGQRVASANAWSESFDRRVPAPGRPA